MAREHARIMLTIWDDEDFRALSPAAQHLYFALIAHPKLDYCGVTDWRPSRIAGFAGAWTAHAVEVAAQELSESGYIVIDLDTEEVLLRSFIRNDGFMDQPNMALAMQKAHRAVSSAALRGIVVHELVRLHQDKPELKGWGKVSDMLGKGSVDPSGYPSFRASDQGSPTPSATDGVKPSGSPSGQPSPTTAPSSQHLTPGSQHHKSEDQDLGGKRLETLRAVTATGTPKDNAKCSQHPDGNPSNVPCAGCARIRELRDRDEQRERDRQRRDLEAARNACPDCDGVWLLTEDGQPSGKKCSHPKTRRAS